MENIKFGYIKEKEADQFSFYRMPKALFTDGYFRRLSCDAKVLYGMMLDRVGLSIKNRWFDSEGRAYIFFTIEDVMGMLGCQSQKAVRLVKELDAAEGIGLIEKKRVGLGKPNIIYVKNFMAREAGGTYEDTAGREGSAGNLPGTAAGMYPVPAGGQAGREAGCGTGTAAFDNQNFGFPAGNVENVDNVDKRDSGVAAMCENQISGEQPACFPADACTAGGECMKRGGQPAADSAGQMPGTAGLLGTAGMKDAGSMSAGSAGEKGYTGSPAGTMRRGMSGESRQDAEKYGLLPEFCRGRGITMQEYPGTQSRNSEKHSPGTARAETPALWNAKRNETDIKDTEYSKTENIRTESNHTDFSASNPFNRSNPSDLSGLSHPACQPGMAGAGMQDGRQAGCGEPDCMAEKMDAYREVIRENISYACFRPQEMEDVDELVELMADTMTVPDRHVMRIAGNEKPAAVVKSCFMKLAHSHIRYVMECLQKHTGKIWNIKAYLLTALYNSALTIGSYYRAEANHDLYGC